MFSKEILSIRAFRDLWLGQAISQVGDALYYVVLAFMVKKVTGRNDMVGYAGALEALPYLMFSPYAGVLADRLNRRKLMLLSDLLSAAVLVLFAGVILLDSRPPVEAIFATGFLLSTMRVFFMPAKSASIPMLVPQHLLNKANSLSMATQSVMPILGLAISATVLAALYAVSEKWFFLASVSVNAASFLGSAYFIRRLPPLRPVRDGQARSGRELRAGVQYIRSRHVLKALLVLSMLLNLAISPFFVFYVATNEAWFGNRPQGLAWFEMTFFVGMVLGSTLVSRWNVRRVGFGYAGATAALGIAVAAMAFSPHFWLYLLWNLACGIAVPFGQIPLQTYLQTTVEDAFRGRVNSVLSMASIGVQPLGMGLGGLMLDRFGLVNGYLIMGGGTVAVAMLALLDRPFRQARLPEAAAPESPEAREAPVEPMTSSA